MHKAGDDVAVAVDAIAPGQGMVRCLGDPGEGFGLQVVERIPLGHKVAVRDLAVDHVVVEYGAPIGRITEPVPAGGHVHVHNLTSLRWTGGRKPASGPSC